MRRKLDVEALRKGMYVAELDRPWTDSPFLFQGFTIESDEELEQLRKTCQFVFVDEEKEDPQLTQRKAGPAPVRDPGPVTKITSRQGAGTTPFSQTINAVIETRETARTNINRVLDDVRMGKSVDTADAKAAVSNMIAQISVNPNSMLWIANLRQKHEQTASHCLNVAILSLAFGRHLDLSAEDMEILGMGALLHDVGKMRIPPEVLDKPNKLSEEELQIVRKHATDGYAVLKLSRQIPDKALDIVRWHHESLDGRGYPDGLVGDSFPLLARIVGIVDAYDDMTADHPYRPAMNAGDALRILRTECGQKFGRDLIQEFIRCLGIYPVGSMVEFKSGALAVVISSTPSSRLKPVVMVIRDEQGRDLKPRILLNLAVMEGALAERWTIRGTADPKAAGIDLPGLIAEESGI